MPICRNVKNDNKMCGHVLRSYEMRHRLFEAVEERIFLRINIIVNVQIDCIIIWPCDSSDCTSVFSEFINSQ